MSEAEFQAFLTSKGAITSPLRQKNKPFTVEGSDATLGTRFFHPTEISYADARQQRRLIVHGVLDLKHGETINPQRLKDDIAATFAVMNHYMEINRNKLNRTDHDSKVVLEHEFIEKHYFFIKDLIDDPPAVGSIIECLIFEQLPAS